MGIRELGAWAKDVDDPSGDKGSAHKDPGTTAHYMRPQKRAAEKVLAAAPSPGCVRVKRGRRRRESARSATSATVKTSRLG